MTFEKKVALPGSRRAPLPHASVAGPVDNNEVISVTLVLRARTALPKADTYAYSAHGPAAHDTREEYGVAHGAPPSCIDAVKEFAHEYGLAIADSSQQKRSIVLSGTVENMQRAFGTELSYFDTPHGRYRGRTGEVLIPEELEPALTAVLGL